jgi:tellurite resistance protein TerC
MVTIASVVTAGTLVAPAAPHWVDWLILVALLVISTGVDSYLNSPSSVISSRRAWIQAGVWVGVAVLFGLYLTIRFGGSAGSEYFTAYPLELSLSFDNVFMFQVLLVSVAVSLRPTLLTWAVVIAIVLRAVFLFIGVAVLEQFAFIVLIFGVFLFYTAFRMGQRISRGDEDETKLEATRSYRIALKLLPLTRKWYGLKLITKKESTGRSFRFTPATLIIVVLSVTDLLFAVDSVPAVLAVTRHSYIALAAVMMAVICLKSLYHVYGALAERFPRIDHVLVGVLVFIGVKLVLGFFGIDVFSAVMSLVVVIAILISGVIWSEGESQLKRRREGSVLDQ